MVAICFGALFGLTGCQSGPQNWRDKRPVAHSVQAGNVTIRSNFVIADDAPIIKELEQLQLNITETLQLPPPRDPVMVYLFSGESEYRRYMRKTWPSLPARRAYFIGTSRELAVYSFHGPHVEVDLRHELTHGLLHATLNSVPLWLDEGLAEYFEVRGPTTGNLHPEHLRTLQRAARKNWNPSIARLEGIVNFQEFDRQDYAESWGWVHFLLHDNPDGKRILLDFLSQLKNSDSAGSFQAKLQPFRHQLVAHVSGLKDSTEQSFLRL
ncbi:MAG: DUF1570 domain-containing protein [Fuerstiella sp.]|nr:DUF1570 domain-containing protein [Fuerstiella sp.]